MKYRRRTIHDTHRVLIFDSSGNFLHESYLDDWGDRPFEYSTGESVAKAKGGYKYAIDASNHCVRKLDPKGNLVTKWGFQGAENGEFRNPSSIAVDHEGNVYVLDRGNNRIQKFDSSGKFVTKWGSYGYKDGQFYYPFRITVIKDSLGYKGLKFAVAVYDRGPKTRIHCVAGKEVRAKLGPDSKWRFKCVACGRKAVDRVSFPRDGLCTRCSRYGPNVPGNLSENIGATGTVEEGLTKPVKADIPRNLSENLVVTRRVEERLTKQAKASMPRSLTDILVSVGLWVWLGMFVSSPFVTWGIFFHEYTALSWLFLFGWGLGGPFAVMLIMGQILAGPTKKRNEQVAAKVRQLANERKERLDDRERFYSSPEWLVIRKQVIEQEGRICAECKKKIVHNKDITVDHKYPRSKYPELALQRENLRVLCRSCNATKGSGEWVEGDDDNTTP